MLGRLGKPSPMFPPKKGEGGKKMFKSFFEWFFRDSIKISSSTLDEGSKRVGKLLAILVVVSCPLICIFIIFLVGSFSSLNSVVTNISLTLLYTLLGVISGWFIYRLVRIIFWVIDGFRNPK